MRCKTEAGRRQDIADRTGGVYAIQNKNPNGVATAAPYPTPNRFGSELCRQLLNTTNDYAWVNAI